MTDSINLTAQGAQLAEAWLSAKSTVEKLQKQMADANTDLDNTAAYFAKWMLPADAKPGERFAVPYKDMWVQVEVTTGSPIVSIRPRAPIEDVKPIP